MYIKNLKIDSFGVLQNREFTFCSGLNIIEGDNESGKSALAMFIKFILYGLSGKASGGELSERRRYVNWDTGCAAGAMTVTDGETEYRIERSLSVSRADDGARTRESARETVRMLDTASYTQVHRGEVPGEVLFGVPETIFMNTVFVRQLDGTRPSGTSLLASIENLLFTADENVGTKKAMERLDGARKQILYKNGSGGELFDARNERSRAAAELRAAQAANGGLLGAQRELEASEKECGELRAEIEKKEKICADGEISVTKRRFDTVAAAQRKLDSLRAEQKQRAAEGIDRAYLSQLDECARRIAENTAAIAQLEEALHTLEGRLRTADSKAEKIAAETEAVLSRAESLRTRMRAMGAAAAAMLFFAILACAGGWLLSYFHVSLYPVPLVFAGVLAALGVLCLILRGRAAAATADLLREWDAADTDALEEAVASAMGGTAELSGLQEEKCRLDAACAEARAKRRAEIERGFALAARACPHEMPEDEKRAQAEIAAVLREAKKAGEQKCAALESLEREANTLQGRLSLLCEQLSGISEEQIRREFAENIKTVEGRIASGMDAAKLETARRELDTLKRELQAKEEHRHELELRLTAERAVSVSPAALAGRITELDEKIDALTMRHEAYCLAIETLEKASEAMRAGVLPRVIDEACASANRISGGSFDAIGVGHDLSMTFTRGTQTREVEYLSEGTKDIAYISLRRALTGALFSGARPPLIYDESFARVDEARLERILSMLSASGGDGGQSIVLTCRRLEGEIAAKNGGVSLIRL
ncbi:MAG: ATP-binding protein [Eubacteriales bacterium]